MTILMHGPAFTESGEIVERYVPQADVVAFRNAGYAVGPIPDHLKLRAILHEAQAQEAKKTEKKGK
jgi:hypothetical protein